MDNFIEVYKGVFNDAFCKEAIDIFHMSEQHGLTRNRQEHDQVPRLVKEDNAAFIPALPMHSTSLKLVAVFNKVFWDECYKQYADKYSTLQRCQQHNNYTLKIQKTEPGQGYHEWHCETTCRNTSARLLTWSVYLNDDFDAGETEFLYQQYRYKPSKGDVVIFPAAFTHTHRGNPPIGGDKYIITGWVEF